MLGQWNTSQFGRFAARQLGMLTCFQEDQSAERSRQLQNQMQTIRPMPLL